MRTLLNMILFVPIGNNYIIKFFSGNCDYKLQYHRYSVSVMPILSMKLFDHFGNHIWDLDKVPYITCILYLNQIGKKYFIIPKQLFFQQCGFISTTTSVLSHINVIL